MREDFLFCVGTGHCALGSWSMTSNAPFHLPHSPPDTLLGAMLICLVSMAVRTSLAVAMNHGVGGGGRRSLLSLPSWHLGLVPYHPALVVLLRRKKIGSLCFEACGRGSC